MYKNILIPTDGFEQSERAVQAGLEWVRRLQAQALVVLVMQPPISYAGLSFEHELRQEGQAVVDRWEKYGAGRHIAVKGHFAEGGDVAHKLVDLASQAGCDLIVMGTHGREGLARLFLGSVAERVVRLSRVPVLLLRFDGALQSAQVFPERILVALDGGKASELALDQAIGLGQVLGSELVLLHVVPNLWMPPAYETLVFDVANRQELDAQMQAEGQALLSKAQARSQGLKTKTLLRHSGDPRVGQTILEAAQKEKAQLIVLGTHGYSGFDRLLLGSVAETVAHHAPMPVLLVRPSS
jgi:nucleotide-binding universal stress UspA family protein